MTVQRNFRKVYWKDAPTDQCIHKWYQQIQQETGSALKGNSPCRPNTSQDNTKHIQVSSQRSPKYSVRHISCPLQIPKSMVQDGVHRRLKLRAYKLQVVQHIQPHGELRRVNSVTFVVEQLAADDSYLQKILFCDKAIFHIHGAVNRHNCRIWGSKNPHALMKHVRDSQGQCEVQHHIRLNCWILLLPWEECSLSGYAKELRVPKIVAEIDISFSNKMRHQSILVLLYTLLWMNNFLVYRLAWEGQFLGLHGVLTEHTQTSFSEGT